MAGCEEEAARQRAEAQEVIESAGRELQLASLGPVEPGDPSFDDNRGRLRRLTQSLSGLRDIEGGQQAAAALIAASAQRSLARMTLTQASAIEGRHRRLHRSLHAEFDAALRLQSLATNNERLSTESARQLLADERSTANRELRDFSERMAELDEPIREREAKNTEDAAEAERLDIDATRLRRRAAQAGPADGLPDFEEAVELERRADGFELAIAMREGDLRYDLRPEHELADTRSDGLRQVLTGIGDTEAAFDEFDSGTRDRATSTREELRSARARIEEIRAALAESSSNDLDPLYEEARGHLDQSLREARSAARNAGRGDDVPARMIAVSVLTQQADVRAREWRALAAQADVLLRLIEAGPDLGDPNALGSALDGVETARDAAKKEAVKLIGEARTELQAINDNNSADRTKAIGRTLDQMQAAITGMPMPIHAETDHDDAHTGGARKSGGPDSAQALLDRLRATNDGVLESVHATQPGARRMIKLLAPADASSREFMAAVEAHFGAAAGDMHQAMAGIAGASGMGGGLASFAGARLVDETETEAFAAIPGAAGVPAQRIRLIPVGGRWMIDGDAVFADVTPGDLELATLVMSKMDEVMSRLATRVRAGEFATLEALQQAMMAEVMSSMSSMPGMPGMDGH